MTLNTSRRHTIATAGPDKYLVSLSVTTTAAEAVAAANATDAIINGFRIGVPGAAPAPRLPAAAGRRDGRPALARRRGGVASYGGRMLFAAVRYACAPPPPPPPRRLDVVTARASGRHRSGRFSARSHRPSSPPRRC